jgi:small conductance mechanosensitive channel
MDLSRITIPPDTWNLLLGFATRAAGVLALLLVAMFLSRRLAATVQRACTAAKMEATLVKFAGKAVQWSVMVLAVVMALGTFGIKTTSFAAVLGAAGLAIGLALQGTLSHLAAGVMLLIFRPFKVGDTVEIGGKRGKVDEIDLFFTILDTPDNRRFILPNGQVFGASIENVTYHEVRRADVLVGTSYGADVDKVRQVLTDAAAAVPGQVEGRAPQIVLAGLGASSIDWEVRIWAPRDTWLDVFQAGRRQVKVALDEAGISIPFPQLDVHLDGGLSGS